MPAGHGSDYGGRAAGRDPRRHSVLSAATNAARLSRRRRFFLDMRHEDRLHAAGFRRRRRLGARLCRAGMAVFPVNADKKPLTTRGVKDATTDEEQIRAWWARYPHADIGWAVPEESSSSIST